MSFGDEVTSEGGSARDEPDPDYSKDEDNATPLKFEAMTNRVAHAVESLDAHIDTQLAEIGKTSLQIQIDMVAAVDMINNTVSRRLAKSDRRNDANTFVCVLLVIGLGFLTYYDAIRLGGRDKGRSIQIKILCALDPTDKECQPR